MILCELLFKVYYVWFQALASVGLNISKGALIWEAYREFENAILSMSQDEKSKKDQKAKIKKLFERQVE